MESSPSRRGRVTVVVVVVVIIMVLLLAFCNLRQSSRIPGAITQSPFPQQSTVTLSPGAASPDATITDLSTPTPASRTQQATATITQSLPPSPLATITSLQVDVRSGPDLAYPVILTLPGGIQVEVIGRNQQGTWLAILTPEKLQGWIPVVTAQLNVPINSLPVVAAPPEPAPGQTTPYGQGLLTPPELPGLAPSAYFNQGRYAIATFSMLLLISALAILRMIFSHRSLNKRKTAISWLLQYLLSN